MGFKISRMRSYRHRYARHVTDDAVIVELMMVWGIDLGNPSTYSAAYLDHCNQLRSLFEEDGIQDANRQDLVEIVNVVKATHGHGIREIAQAIQAANPKWASSISDNHCVQNILDFVVRLWLFVEPDLTDSNLKLSEVMKQALPKPNALSAKGTHLYHPKTGFPYGHTPSFSDPDDFWYLPRDFCEKSLTRKAAIKLEWTSYLPDHLTFAGKSRLRVFRHASAIQQAARAPDNYPYPLGFLEETERTIALLFDPAGGATSKRTRRIERRNYVDLEAAMKSVGDSDARLDLRNYPFWQERLRKVQQVYDEAQPKTLKQWLFDRRNPFNWATFWTALVVFALTIFFGIISSVTGIMQVYIAFHPPE